MICKKNVRLTVFSHIFTEWTGIQNAILQIFTEQLEKYWVDFINLSQKITAVMRLINEILLSWMFWIVFPQAIYSLLLLCVNPELLMFKVGHWLHQHSVNFVCEEASVTVI
jgi:hypothetical protein